MKQNNPVGDLISREALKEALTDGTRDIYVFVCLSRVLEKIDNAPAVEDRPQGIWVDSPDGLPKCCCSLCGAKNVTIWRSFCPNCGAKIQGDKE